MTVAVVIPARNAALVLDECIERVRRQTARPDEIIVVVGPSTDETRRVAGRHADASTHVIENRSGDRASALNTALGALRADVVAMVDAQARLAPTYLEEAMRVLRETGAGVVGGPMHAVGPRGIGAAMAASLRSPFGVGDSQFHFTGERRDADSVYLGVYRADVFQSIGRYNVALLRTEDDDLNARAREAGFRIVLDPRIASDYRCRTSLAEIWRQYFGYGYWKVPLVAIRPGALRIRHLVPAAFIVALCLAAAVSFAAWWPALPVIGSAWVAAAAAASVAARDVPVASRLLMPAVFLTMHLAYGAGTLLGIASLPRTWRRAIAGAAEARAFARG